ncbi:LamG-like jellyroll fold domain-containing protein [Lysinibacillus fusiformis]|uniref:LamG-like jellyroll fold domain-containing protein n=1 Tax=Lysinibacillus fusiformis TaxID=28031 RepID=UPI0037F86D11
MATTEELMRQYGVAWFGFDEASGNVYDKLGNGYGGTVTGAIRVNGWNDNGYSIKSSGINQYVGFNSPIVPHDIFTIKFKIKATSNTSAGSYFLGNVHMGTTNANYGFTLATMTDFVRYIEVTTNGNTINCYIDIYGILDNKWHDIIIAKNSNKLVSIYVDEKLYGTVLSTTIFNATNPLGLLNATSFYGQAGRWLNGQLDDLQIYNKALSPSDFTQKRLVVKTTDNKNLVLSPTSARVKEIPNTAEYMMLAQGGIVREIDSAVDSQPIDFTKPTTEYELVTNNRTPLGKGRMFTIPIGSDFKTAMIEDNY